jgi:hypothetical protein
VVEDGRYTLGGRVFEYAAEFVAPPGAATEVSDWLLLASPHKVMRIFDCPQR